MSTPRKLGLHGHASPFSIYALRRDGQGRLCSDEQGVLPEGPWHAEPDREDFTHAQLPCLLLRDDGGGQWCGYVGIPDDHPWFAVDLHALDAAASLQISVHGGVTWGGDADALRPREQARRWVGFDCGHVGLEDQVLSPRSISRLPGRSYRDLAFARAELQQLAEQVAAAGKRA